MISQINNNDKIIEFFKKNLLGKKLITVITVAVLTVSGLLYSAVQVPHIFKAGEVISAEQVNANFKILQDKINELEANLGGAPPGSILPYSGDTAPQGWLICDGKSYAKNEYQDLFNIISTKWGEDGDKFRVPDLRGVFLRGKDNGAERDPDRNSRFFMYIGGNVGDTIGSYQLDAFQNHTHPAPVPYALGGCADGCSTKLFGEQPTWDYSTQNPNSGKHTTETRPINAYVNYIIKY